MLSDDDLHQLDAASWAKAKVGVGIERAADRFRARMLIAAAEPADLLGN